MRKIMLAAALLLAAASLSGCKSFSEYADDAARLIGIAREGIAEARAGARRYCAGIVSVANNAQAAASALPAGKACKAKDITAGIAASVATACANVDTATVATIVTISRGVIDAYQRAESAAKAGC